MWSHEWFDVLINKKIKRKRKVAGLFFDHAYEW